MLVFMVAVFWWALFSGQFDDLEARANRVLLDDRPLQVFSMQVISLTSMAALGFLLAARVVAQEGRLPRAAECPQPRFTGKAPPEYLDRTNPLARDAQTLEAGANLYFGRPKSLNCSHCHGEKGDGRGVLASQFNPRPRNFACEETVNGIPDGQLFWIIRHGSPDTAMPPSRNLNDQQVWQLVAYIRQLANYRL